MVSYPDLIANLWYVHDPDGYIMSLRARLYVGIGDDKANLFFLKKAATVDYTIARPFPIPERLHTRFQYSDQERVMPVVHMTSLAYRGGEFALFEEVLAAMEGELPADSPLSLGQAPLVVITPLEWDGEGVVRPSFTKQTKL